MLYVVKIEFLINLNGEELINGCSEKHLCWQRTLLFLFQFVLNKTHNLLSHNSLEFMFFWNVDEGYL